MSSAAELESEVREAIREWAEENPDNNDIDYNGSLSEIVDSAVPIWTSELFELAAAYPEFRYDDEGLADPERGAEHVIQVAIYGWLQGHAWDEWREIQEERESVDE